jgi:small subunit ribosomal protein S16
MLAKDNENRIKMDLERIKHWLSQGAQPTDRLARMLEAAGVIEKKVRNNPKAALPGKRMAELAKKKAARSAAPAEAAAE